MTKLRYIAMSSSLILTSNHTLIESTLLNQCSVIYHHMSAKDEAELSRVRAFAEALCQILASQTL